MIKYFYFPNLRLRTIFVLVFLLYTKLIYCQNFEDEDYYFEDFGRQSYFQFNENGLRLSLGKGNASGNVPLENLSTSLEGNSESIDLRFISSNLITLGYSRKLLTLQGEGLLLFFPYKYDYIYDKSILYFGRLFRLNEFVKLNTSFGLSVFGKETFTITLTDWNGNETKSTIYPDGQYTYFDLTAYFDVFLGGFFWGANTTFFFGNSKIQGIEVLKLNPSYEIIAGIKI